VGETRRPDKEELASTVPGYPEHTYNRRIRWWHKSLCNMIGDQRTMCSCSTQTSVIARSSSWLDEVSVQTIGRHGKLGGIEMTFVQRVKHAQDHRG